MKNLRIVGQNVSCDFSELIKVQMFDIFLNTHFFRLIPLLKYDHLLKMFLCECSFYKIMISRQGSWAAEKEMGIHRLLKYLGTFKVPMKSKLTIFIF